MITTSIVGKDELCVIQNLANKIWPDAYKTILSNEQLIYMLDKFYSIPALRSQLLDRNHIFLLAKINGKDVGFASYELACSSKHEEIRKAKLHKLYVLPDLQTKGIGKFLLQEVEKRVINSNCNYLFLNVNRNNKAQEFYKKYNFKIVKSEDISIGNGFLMEDYIMEKCFT